MKHSVTFNSISSKACFLFSSSASVLLLIQEICHYLSILALALSELQWLVQSLRESPVFEPSFETIGPRYLKLVTVPSFCPLTLILVWMPLALFVISLVFSALISMSQTLKKILHAPVEDWTGDPSIYSLALNHVAIKAGLYGKAVQVYYIPNLYPVTFSPSILNSSSNSKKYKNHWKWDLRSSKAHVGHLHWVPVVTDS